MGMTKGEKDDIRDLVGGIIQKRLNEITSSLPFKAAVDASSIGLTEELVGEKIADLLKEYEKADDLIDKARERARKAEKALDDAIFSLINELEKAEPGSELVTYWGEANGRQSYSRVLYGRNTEGLRKTLRHAAKERAAQAAEFGDIAKLRALQDNIEMLVLTATSNAQINKVIQGMYRKFATENDQISMELVSDMFPFLFLNEE